jgi:hypothetical protein
MRQLNGVYTQMFNRQHDRVGHVFQGRYKAIHVEKETYLLELARYIVLNPVRARRVRKVENWPWSSYHITAGQKPSEPWLNVEWLLVAFGSTRRKGINAYKRFVDEGKKQPAPWEVLKNQVFLGSDDFVKKTSALIDGDKALSEIPSSQRRPKPLTLKKYAASCADRNSAIYKAYMSGGYTQKEIGDYFGLHYAQVSRIIKKVKGEA